MKKQFKFGLLVIAFIGLMLTGCQDDTIDTGTSTETVDVKSLETSSEIDYVSDGAAAIVEDVYYNEEYPNAAKSFGSNRYLPDCVTITIVLVQNMKTVTIDFGDECELRNGDVASGKIIMEYEKDPEAATRTISYSFEDFYYNDKHLEGTGSVLRERLNENGNPQSTLTADLKLTWPDETYATSAGTRVREWIEGYGSGVWGDNVFLITGNWTFMNRAGTTYSGTIIEPLRRELACRFIVSGTAEVSKNEITGILDYGAGECDDLATLTIGDTVREIHLSNYHPRLVRVP